MKFVDDNALVDEVSRRGLEREVLARMTFQQSNEALRELFGLEMATVPEPELLEATFESGMVTELRDGDLVLLGIEPTARAGKIEDKIEEALGVVVTVARVATPGLFQVLRGGES